MSTTNIAAMKIVNSAASFRRETRSQTRCGGRLDSHPALYRTRLFQMRRRSPIVACAEPEIDIEKAVKDAEQTCEANENAAECATAWDTVEELSAAQAHKKENAVSDPLEQYCEEEPDADECRVYED